MEQQHLLQKKVSLAFIDFKQAFDAVLFSI